MLRLCLSLARLSKKLLRVIHYSGISCFLPFLIIFLETVDILVVVALPKQSYPDRAFLPGVSASLSYPSSRSAPFLCRGFCAPALSGWPYSSLSYVSLVQLLRTVSAKLQPHTEAACPKSGR